jgi:hypothetical protein
VQPATLSSGDAQAAASAVTQGVQDSVTVIVQTSATSINAASKATADAVAAAANQVCQGGSVDAAANAAAQATATATATAVANATVTVVTTGTASGCGTATSTATAVASAVAEVSAALGGFVGRQQLRLPWRAGWCGLHSAQQLEAPLHASHLVSLSPFLPSWHCAGGQLSYCKRVVRVPGRPRNLLCLCDRAKHCCGIGDW